MNPAIQNKTDKAYANYLRKSYGISFSSRQITNEHRSTMIYSWLALGIAWKEFWKTLKESFK